MDHISIPIADTTATTGRAPRSPAVIWHATRMRSAEPMLVPPNFITSKLFNSIIPFRWKCDRG